MLYIPEPNKKKENKYTEKGKNTKQNKTKTCT